MPDPTHILIVEDEPVGAECLKGILAQAGFPRSEIVTSGEDALTFLARTADIGIILMDIQLPNMSGIDVLRHLKCTPALQHIPVIVVTVATDPNRLAQAFDAGAVDYLTKPVHAEELVARMRSVLQLKNALDQSRAAAVQFSTIFEKSMDVILIIHAETGVVLKTNTAMTRLLGYALEETIGKHFSFLFPEHLRATSAQVLDSIHASDAVFLYQQFQAANHTPRYMDVTVTTIPWNHGDAILATLRDTTERKLFEEERIKSAKLESVGTLAGGMAHDFNNMLLCVDGNISLARENLGDIASAGSFLERAQSACERARHTASQLLIFAKGGAPIKKIHHFKEFMASAISLPFHSAKRSLSLSIAPDMNSCEMDENQIRLALHHIITNACEATPEGGRIEIDCHNVGADSRQTPRLPTGNYVAILIRDHGCGIPEHQLTKIFDPYFTTKSGHHGLGLTTAHSIIRSHDGYLLAESHVGEGSTFQIYLPACATPAPVAAPGTVTSTPSAARHPASARILLMDDEESIRELMYDMLTHLGHHVVAVADGHEAIGVFKETIHTPTPFDLVILDLTVPNGMGGLETLQHLTKIDPHVKAIVCSGYSTDPVMAHYQRYGFVGVLPKPFPMKNMQMLLDEVLGIC